MSTLKTFIQHRIRSPSHSNQKRNKRNSNWKGRSKIVTADDDTIPQFSSVQSLSRVGLLATSWTAACHVSLSFTNSQSLFKLMSIESVMPSNHLILCCPLLLLPSIFPRIRVFPNESVLCIRWPKYWSFSISHSNEYSGLISFQDSLV